jgi:uncharacterized membrane-anchored protein YhcB (DUF1043 family)
VNEAEIEPVGKSRMGLIVVGVLVVALVASNVWVYMTLQAQVDGLQGQLSSLNATYLNYVASHSYTDAEYESLNTTYNDYVNTHSHSDTEYTALEAERDAYKAPKLNLLNLQSSDEWSLVASYLHYYGEVWNVGNETAYDCRLHVTAYQGTVKAIDTWIGLGTIPGENKKSLNVTLDYEGTVLTTWNVSAAWVDKHFH